MMSTSSEPTARCVALVGNPNTGKSTLFSALVGVHQRVGNYPGVTVEKKTGQTQFAGACYTIVDLPGLYSLAPHSRDEMVSVDVLLGRQSDLGRVDAVICIVDASNLQRNLYLVSQVLELGLPAILAVNMLDVAAEHGIRVDLERLERQLGIPVIAMQAHRRVGLEELRAALAQIVDRGPPPFACLFPAAFEEEVTRLESSLAGRPVPAAQAESGPCSGLGSCPGHCGQLGWGWRIRKALSAARSPSAIATAAAAPLPRPLVQRLLLDTGGRLQAMLFPQADGQFQRELQDARRRLAAAGCGVPEIETAVRYRWVQRILEGVVSQPRDFATTVSDRVDHVLTHRVWGALIFAAVMLLVFQAVFVWARPAMGAIETGIDGLGGWIRSWMADGAMRSLLIDGVLAGVGGIMAFLPQIVILFAFLAVLEDCGYMARAAYLMDWLMARVGLSGKSFIPLLSSFACAIPGIMATRVIENERDRLTTILVAPLMTCSARLPVYALLISAFIPHVSYLGGSLDLQGLTLAALYVLGIVTAVAAAKLLKRTALRGDPPPFVMELPSYKWPSLRTVVLRVVERAFSFVQFAGTMILLVSIAVWAALYFPHNPQAIEPELAEAQQVLEAQLASMEQAGQDCDEVRRQLAQVDRQIAGAYQRQSYLGRFGRAIEPVFRPLGWDWRIGSAVIASFPAREIVVATLGVIFNLGETEAEDSAATDSDAARAQEASRIQTRLREATRDGSAQPLFTIPVALSVMVFYALCAQCAATLAVIRKETNSWRWPAFTFAYLTTLAYVGAMATYHVATWIGG